MFLFLVLVEVFALLEVVVVVVVVIVVVLDLVVVVVIVVVVAAATIVLVLVVVVVVVKVEVDVLVIVVVVVVDVLVIVVVVVVVKVVVVVVVALRVVVLLAAATIVLVIKVAAAAVVVVVVVVVVVEREEEVVVVIVVAAATVVVYAYLVARCREDEDVWCEEQLEAYRAQANESSAAEEVTTPPAPTTEAPTTEAEPATTTEAPEPTTAPAADQDGGIRTANGGRWDPLLRVIFPQFFNRQPGAAAAIAPRNGFAPNNLGVGPLPLTPAAANAGLLGAANLIPALGRNVASRRRIPLLRANQRYNTGQRFAVGNVGASSLPRNNNGLVGGGGNVHAASFDQSSQPVSNNQPVAGRKLIGGSTTMLASGKGIITLDVSGPLNGPEIGQPRQEQSSNPNYLAQGSRDGPVESAQNNRSTILGLGGGHVGSDNHMILMVTNAPAFPNRTNGTFYTSDQGVLSRPGGTASPTAPSDPYAVDLNMSNRDSSDIGIARHRGVSSVSVAGGNTPLTKTGANINTNGATENLHALMNPTPPNIDRYPGQ
ncbi:LOW QUALITY PROTEIN: hypothetical protein ElyMa_004707000 [Elysia marginata]|uniref:Uncharacterized protein n=1 Tax=Elysia marginata TaxID=1093978 RepID=A0AAV4ICY3_9GAST|nr:LOW QUALITY PROTEIN: hypothetical protein ElyMa_004707000 [Elysia marginata]